MIPLSYFGTDTINYGHYIWSFGSTGESMSKSYDDFSNFDLYKYKSEKKGTVKFFNENGYTVLAITGSCIDTRGGTVSVFFCEGDLTKPQMTQKIKASSAAMNIINHMPFEIDWYF